MGIQNQLSDVSSESIPIFVLAIVANAVSHLRRLLPSILQSFGFISGHCRSDYSGDAVGPGLTNLVFLANHLHLTRVFSYRYGGGGGGDCAVCLEGLSEGEQARELACRHVFHKECFDLWLDHLNFNCPLCRSPLVSESAWLPRAAVSR